MRPPQPPRRPSRNPAQQQPEPPPAPPPEPEPAPAPEPPPEPEPAPPEPSEPEQPGGPEEPRRFLPANPAHRRFKTGLIPTPREKVERALTEGRLRRHRAEAAPPQVIYPLPPQLSFWLNDQEGDCVTAEEAAAIAAFCMFLGVPEVFISDRAVKDFCDRFDLNNGAELLDVVQHMQAVGLVGPDGRAYKDGAPSVVDPSDEEAVRSAIAQNGPLKIGISSSCLPGGAGNQMGWSAFGPARRGQEDHCVGLWHYGPTKALCQAFGWQVPAGAPDTAYTLYTWKTVGLVDWAWLQGAMGEAYTRSPTDTTVQPPAPTPTPTPTPTPPPPPDGLTITLLADLPAGTYTLTPSEGAPAGAVTIPPALLAALRALLCAAREAGHDAG